MTTRRVTEPTERVDLLIVQVEQFRVLGLTGEAIARARHALAQCEKELDEVDDRALRADLLTRWRYADYLLWKLGARPGASTLEHSTI